ncbi:hypothetical protein [Deefgea salmonis]|uniref:Uncharacterized protein n=1 Tax=Deefgea salmonis TaxID=2875502 RepID=A0ABS8BMS3_9NEIS|nr:hypothetical protein [Deefgea salmonis]MCB5197020.1 hypothetical protein [Deefgea salmonis]
MAQEVLNFIDQEIAAGSGLLQAMQAAERAFNLSSKQVYSLLPYFDRRMY